jgi:hypothetical protein
LRDPARELRQIVDPVRFALQESAKFLVRVCPSLGDSEFSLARVRGASIRAAAPALNDRASSFFARDAAIAQSLRWTPSPTYCASFN